MQQLSFGGGAANDQGAGNRAGGEGDALSGLFDEDDGLPEQGKING